MNKFVVQSLVGNLSVLRNVCLGACVHAFVCVCMVFMHVCVCVCRWLAQERSRDPSFNLTLDDYNYFDENNISMKISEFMQSTNFEGITVSLAEPRIREMGVEHVA